MELFTFQSKYWWKYNRLVLYSNKKFNFLDCRFSKFKGIILSVNFNSSNSFILKYFKKYASNYSFLRSLIELQSKVHILNPNNPELSSANNPIFNI